MEDKVREALEAIHKASALEEESSEDIVSYFKRQILEDFKNFPTMLMHPDEARKYFTPEEFKELQEKGEVESGFKQLREKVKENLKLKEIQDRLNKK